MAFSYQQVRQPIATLSGGERSRLQLALVMLRQPNLLLLDEPTNNLDIPSVEVLESALDDFVGTVLIISHDRYFLDQTADRMSRSMTARMREYLYTEYLCVWRSVISRCVSRSSALTTIEMYMRATLAVERRINQHGMLVKPSFDFPHRICIIRHAPVINPVSCR